MTLIFSGNEFKYETEAVCKLFYPVERFGFIFSDSDIGEPMPEDDFIFVSRIKGNRTTLLTVYAHIGGKAHKEFEKLTNDTPDYENECEFLLGRLTYRVLCVITGKRPEWGILTGVRPVKLVNKLRARGLSREEIASTLRERYLLTDEKINIGYMTASNQDKIISAMPKNSFSLYVSIPFCPTRCSYCSFVSQTVKSFKKLMPDYVAKLCEEIKYTASLVKQYDLTLDTVYFGGGTPTSIEAEDLDIICRTIAENFDTTHLREYCIEAGRSDTITEEKLRVIKAHGCDRISINPQTMHDHVLETIGRKHTVKQFMDSYALAREVGFNAVNVDLIAGLPADSLEGFKQTVESVIALQPENVTIHALSIKRAADLMQNSDSVDASCAEDMISYATYRLLESGYEPYYLYRQKNQLGNQENIGWTKPGYAGIYNINIMEEVQTIIAVGAGGSTKLVDLEGGELERFFNPKYPLDYLRLYDTVTKRKEEAAALLNKMLNEKE